MNKPFHRAKLCAILACTAVALYFAVSPAFAILHYREFAAATPQFMRYVIVPGLVATAFFLIGFFGKPKLSILIGVYGLSALTGVFLFEAYLTYRQLPVVFGLLGQLNDDQKQLLGRDDDLVRGFTLGSVNRLADTDNLSDAILSGFPSAEVILCAPGDSVLTYQADRHGFNNPDSVYDQAVDVLLMGDSFIEGICLEPGQDVASQLRDRGLVAISMGIRGNGPLFNIATLGRFGPRLKPRHVVMAFFEGNDWENLERELTEPWLRAALTPAFDFGSQAAIQPITQRGWELVRERINSNPVNASDLLFGRATIRNFLALQQTGTLLGVIYPKVAHDIPEFRKVLRRGKEIAESWGGRFTLLYVPRVDRFLGALPSDAAFDQLRDIVLRAAEAESIDVIDLREALRAHPDPAQAYAPDSHFSVEGADFAAEVVFKRLLPSDSATIKTTVPSEPVVDGLKQAPRRGKSATQLAERERLQKP